MLGLSNVADEELTVTIGNRSVVPADVGIANVAIEDEVGAAAYHIPEGILLAYDPRSAVALGESSEPISTTRITPTLLELQGIRPPSYMDRPIKGIAEAELEVAKG